jgi:hypothetical protein
VESHSITLLYFSTYCVKNNLQKTFVHLFGNFSCRLGLTSLHCGYWRSLFVVDLFSTVAVDLKGVAMFTIPDSLPPGYPGTTRISPANLQGYYPLDVPVGGVPVEVTGHGPPITLHGLDGYINTVPPVAWPTQGISMQFGTGSNGYMSIANLGRICYGAGDAISIAFWFRQMAQPNPADWILSGDLSNPGINWFLRSGDGGGHPQTVDFAWESPLGNFNVLRWQDALNHFMLNTWWQLTFTWIFGTPIANAHLYLGGIDQGVPTLPAGNIANAPVCDMAPIYLMAAETPFSAGQVGEMYDVRFYNRLISPAEVLLLA